MPLPLQSRAVMVRSLRRRLWRALQQQDVKTAVRAYTATRVDYLEWLAEERAAAEEQRKLREAAKEKAMQVSSILVQSSRLYRPSHHVLPSEMGETRGLGVKQHNISHGFSRLNNNNHNCTHTHTSLSLYLSSNSIGTPRGSTGCVAETRFLHGRQEQQWFQKETRQGQGVRPANVARILDGFQDQSDRFRRSSIGIRSDQSGLATVPLYPYERPIQQQQRQSQRQERHQRSQHPH